ncbi:hypothetical protein MHM93_17345 [Pseudoalteromonas sp. MM17-2]|uniref:hypothetical protein n=1 Tax=Pseudoalteromonas sp. MM17-2 TaxID=2917753 RepID=UPI001EF549BC|nr:hypothetical protein [Pseudoalteromonas sp. MM17-2]MCG7545949.1 hypothetical protein [Pseudoalteromonas sp. MM17-2]
MIDKFKQVFNKLKSFYFQVKKTFRSEYITNLSGAQAVGEFLKLAFAPFYLSFALGLMTLASDEKWNGVFMTAIDEFMQLTGLKLSLYTIFVVIGVSFLFYHWTRVTGFCAMLVRTLSHAGFAMTAIVFGVLWGITIPACVDAGSISPLKMLVVISSFFVSIAIAFFYSAKVFSSNVRSEIDTAFGKHTGKATFVIGVICILVGVKFIIIDEKWSGTQPEKTSCPEVSSSK